MGSLSLTLNPRAQELARGKAPPYCGPLHIASIKYFFIIISAVYKFIVWMWQNCSLNAKGMMGLANVWTNRWVRQKEGCCYPMLTINTFGGWQGIY